MGANEVSYKEDPGSQISVEKYGYFGKNNDVLKDEGGEDDDDYAERGKGQAGRQVDFLREVGG